MDHTDPDPVASVTPFPAPQSQSWRPGGRSSAEKLPDATLDPRDWGAVREQGHRMLAEMFDFLERLREAPVWRPIPAAVRARFREPLPRAGQDLATVHAEFARSILPYGNGNTHPRFMGWVHGGGTVVGMLAEMLAGGLNANLGGRDHMPIEVERQVVEWARQLFDFPAGASGVFVTGTSMANLLAVLVARTARLGADSRRSGIGERGLRLRAYTSAAVHGCVVRAMEAAGLGSDALRLVETDREHRINLDGLRQRLAADRTNGLEPFLVVGSAGTVDVGAIDDLAALARICREEGLWFHVDGAYGALAMLSPALRQLLAGIETADSLAFDFHKWGQVPYDAGFLLVREGQRHRAAFASHSAHLARGARGLAAGSDWPCDYGIDLSRGFRALKTWFTLKTYGADRLGAMIARSCALARYLEGRVRAEPDLELAAPAQLNIVCFRYRSAAADDRNPAIVADLQESGIAAPSQTVLEGRPVIRAAIVNHRTREEDIDALVDGVLRLGVRYEARREAAE